MLGGVVVIVVVTTVTGGVGAGGGWLLIVTVWPWLNALLRPSVVCKVFGLRSGGGVKGGT